MQCDQMENSRHTGYYYRNRKGNERNLQRISLSSSPKKIIPAACQVAGPMKHVHILTPLGRSSVKSNTGSWVYDELHRKNDDFILFLKIRACLFYWEDITTP